MAKYNKKHVRFSKALVKEICEYISRDVSVAQLYREDPTRYPRPETFSRWMSNKGDEIREMYEQARRLQMSTIDDKYTDMLSQPPEHTGDKALDSHNYKIWQTKLNHLRDRLARLAPIFNKVYDKASKVEHSGEVQGPQIVIQSYLDQPTEASVDNKKPHVDEAISSDDKDGLH